MCLHNQLIFVNIHALHMLSKRLCLNLTVDATVSINSISCYHILAILYSGLGCFYSLIFYGKTKRCNSYVDMVEFRIL